MLLKEEIKIMFIQFLKQNNALASFSYERQKWLEICRLKNDNIYILFRHLSTDGIIPNINSPSTLIGNAFPWRISKNGYGFWYELDKQWRKSCFDKYGA